MNRDTPEDISIEAQVVELRRYSLGELQDAGKNYQLATSRGELNTFEALLELGQFRFRTADGFFWFYDPRRADWYRFDDSVWLPSEQPQGPLEGEATLSWVPSRTPEEVEREMQSIFGSDEEYRGDTTATLLALISHLREAYEGGLLTSIDAQELAGEKYVVDRSGRPWCVGLQSLTWYRFEGVSWESVEHAPDADQIVPIMKWPEVCENCGHAMENEIECPSCAHMQSPEVEFDTDEAMMQFQSFMLIGIGSVPEIFSEGWVPPASVPDLPIISGSICRRCGNINPVDSVFCNQCASALGCLQCGAINRIEDAFCTQCGQELPEVQFDPQV